MTSKEINWNYMLWYSHSLLLRFDPVRREPNAPFVLDGGNCYRRTFAIGIKTSALNTSAMTFSPPQKPLRLIPEIRFNEVVGM